MCRQTQKYVILSERSESKDLKPYLIRSFDSGFKSMSS